MELRLLIQQAQQLNVNNQQIHYDGNDPQSLKIAMGPLPPKRQWPNYTNYIDVTHDVSDLHKLKLTWTNDRDSTGVQTPGMFNSKKVASGVLSFEGETYRLIRNWLIDDVSATLNSVKVKIEQPGCKDGYYEQFVFTSADLKWCEGEVCIFEISLKQKDEALTCIKQTVIADNHLGWFYTRPLNGKKHPRFSYCNEQRPNGQLVISWWLMSITGVIFYTLIITTIVLIINPILGLLNLIVQGLQSIGIGKNWNIPKPIDPQDLMDGFAQFFVEGAGCGREHPAPLIRDYIYNVCKKCNIDTDSLPVTAPIFFAEYMHVETSARGLIWTKNHHYNACYLHAPVQRGIRRFRSAAVFNAPPNTSDYYIPDNAPLRSLDEFLDELKTLYNAEWRILNNKLYFQRKDYFVDGSYVLDLSANGADRQKLLEGICFEWNEVKYPAYADGLYSGDAGDSCGNEARKHMNTLMSYGDGEQNPNYEGRQNKLAPFGATKFRLDGASEDYVYDAMQVVVNGSFLTPFLAGLFFDFIAPHFIKYSDYGLLLTEETCSLPKVLIWDGASYDNAKAVRPYSAWPIAPQYGPPMPPPNGNTRYGSSVTYVQPEWGGFLNPQTLAGNTWHVKHSPETHVRGQNLTFPPFHEGFYTITDFAGVREIKKPAMLMNYYMYFEPGFEDTMWDWFHWIDDPLRSPSMNMNFTARMELCCDTLKTLGVLGDGTNVTLGQKVLLPGKYYTDGKIKEIEVSYDTKNETGQYIQIKGTL